MATQASKTSIPTPEPPRTRLALTRVLGGRVGFAPAMFAAASLLCLLIGLFYLALQVRTIFSDQLKQEYAGLVLEAVERSDSAREAAGVWQAARAAGAMQTDGYRHARAELTQRLTLLSVLVNASPSGAPRVPASAFDAARPLDEIRMLLDGVAVHWRAQRDASSADVRLRIVHVASTLIALAALLFCMLITALGMYAKRNRQLVGQSHQFEYAAQHDPMTGLANRRKLLAALDEAVASCSPGVESGSFAGKLAVLYIDLDGFKQVNDLRGHRTGDEFLIAVAQCFRESVRKTDLVARIGGDEFAVLVREFTTSAELGEIAARLIACVAEADARMGIGMVRASVGIASFPDQVDDPHRLVAAADEAMYHVKRRGKNGYAFFDALR